MKNFWQKNKPVVVAVGTTIVLWGFLMWLIQLFSPVIPIQTRFLGPLPWANFDGANYLLISKGGYGLYQQAYFPLFPLVIYFVRFFLGTRILAAFIILYPTIVIMIGLFYMLAALDIRRRNVIWSVLFFLLFPTAFFFASIYTESLFVALTLGAFLAMRKKKFFLASILVGLASGTRLVGIFLVFSLLFEYLFYKKKKTIKDIIKSAFYAIVGSGGLLGYMTFLWIRYKDPLLFFHVQPAFGAGRTGEKIILLPQVVVRYIKIFLTVTPNSHDFLIALLEFMTFMGFFLALLFFWKKVRPSYLIFSLCAILLPTLTGTLLSEPRFVLTAFPVFFLVGSIKQLWVKIPLLIISATLLIILTAFFLRGYFIA